METCDSIRAELHVKILAEMNDNLAELPANLSRMTVEHLGHDMPFPLTEISTEEGNDKI